MSKRLQADLALAFCSLIWGATFVVVKGALRDASVFAFLGVRFALAALFLAVIYVVALRKLDRTDLAAGMVLGCFMFAGYACQTIGLQFTSASKAAFITGSSVVMVPLLLAGFGGRRINRSVWAGAVAVLVGLYYLTVPLAGFSALNAGDLWVLGCALMFALHIICVGHYSPRHSVGALTFVQVAVTAVLTAVALPLLAAAGWERPRLAWTGSLGLAIVITAVGATAVAFSVQVWAQRYTTPTHTAVLFSLEPVFAALTALVFVHERLGGRALAGAALVFAGLLLTELRGPAPTAAESSAPTTETASPSP